MIVIIIIIQCTYYSAYTLMVGTTPIACSPLFLNNYSCDNYIVVVIIIIMIMVVAVVVLYYTTREHVYYIL